MIAASGEDKQPHKITFDSNNDASPRFAPDGRRLYFQRFEPGGGNGQNSVQIYSVWLERQERDPDDAEERAEAEPPQREAPAAEGGEGAPPAGRRPPANRPPRETKMDWDGMKRRTRQVTRMPFPVLNYAITPDSRTIVFVTTEPSATASVPVIYSIRSAASGSRES